MLELLSGGYLYNSVEDLTRKYLGRKYDWDHFNCYHFLVEWFKDIGYNLPGYEVNRGWNHEGKNYFVEEYHKLWQRVEPSEIKEYDVALIKIHSPVPNHVGIYIGNNKFIHCPEKIGVVISDLNIYSRFIHSFYRLKERV